MRFFGDYHVICMIYDGVENSVFASQVLQPLLNELAANERLTVTLISFERRVVDISRIVSQSRMRVIICPRLPFVGRLSLIYALWKSKRTIRGLVADCIIARGPLAGYIALAMISRGWIGVKRCVVQARGLCAEEYRYVNSKKRQPYSRKIIQWFMYRSFKSIECFVYASNGINNHVAFSIEAVSKALKKYLVDEFCADPEKIFIAQHDDIVSIDRVERAQMRVRIRAELSIEPDAQVYCYSGSYKPWQGFDEMLAYFECQCIRDQKSFLLVISKDVDVCKQRIKRTLIGCDRYRVIAVENSDVMKYLCVADYGFLFRDCDVINWVSRPTKMLEYKAAGLTIIHNYTIESLMLDHSRQKGLSE